MTEEEIYAGCRRGDNSSRRELYDRYSGVMLAIGMRYLADRPTAEDVLHDVFVNVFCNFEKFTFRGEGSLKAWLKRVMVNASLDWLRKDSQTDTVEPDTLKDDESYVTTDGVETVPAEVIMRFVQALPQGYRTVFNLYIFEEKSHKEIAALLGINEKSSSSQLSRAKAILAREINDYMKKEL